MRLHLVDGTFELFRAHFSKRPPHVGPTGKDLKATAGVASSLLRLLSEPDTTHLAVAFDNPIRSFRNELFAGYKTEAGIAPELLAQFDEVERAVAALGVVVWSMRDFEADDALATGAARFAPLAQVSQVRLLTPDKDLHQCLGPKVVQEDRIRQRLIDEATLLAEKGLRPASVPDFLGLVGDAADGIPGIEGWGAKSTAEVLRAHPHLEDIPLAPSAWGAKPRSVEKLSAALRHRWDDALLYRRLATLRTDVPLRESVDELEWRGAPREAFAAWSREVGLESLATRVKRWR